MRSLIFEKYSSVEKPWMVSDSCIGLFDVDKALARERAKKWWESNGSFARLKPDPPPTTLILTITKHGAIMRYSKLAATECRCNQCPLNRFRFYRGKSPEWGLSVF